MNLPWQLAVAFLLLGVGCEQRTLVAVAPCPDDGGVYSSCRSLSEDATNEPAASSLRIGLVGLWHLDDLTGSTSAADSSGQAVPNNGALKDLDPAAAWVRGQLGGALETKAAGYVLVKPSSSIDAITEQVTVAAWVYLQGTITDFATALSREISANNGLLQIYHLSLNAEGHPIAFITRSDYFYRQPMAPKPVAQMVWTHLAVTYDGHQVVLYVDGTKVDNLAMTGTLGADTTPIILGGNTNPPNGVTERFPGRLDEVVLYNRALSEAEILELATGVLF